MRLIDNLLPTVREPEQPRNLVTPGSFGFNGSTYPILGWQGSRPDWPDSSFLGYIAGVHRRNGVVAAAVEARALILSQLRFHWQVNNERLDNRSSRALNRPAGSTRPEFLKTLEYDASYHGSAYIAAPDGNPRRLRPDHCSVIMESNTDPSWDASSAQWALPWDAEVTGLVYHPECLTGGPISGSYTVFTRGEFAIWRPEPDPVNIWRGISWIESVMREIVADGQAIDHTTKFFENAATPNLVFLMDPSKTPTEIQEFADVLNANHTGGGKAFKNMFLGGGTSVTSVGSSLDSLNLKDLTGGYETRIALRARIPGVILGVREGYAGSSLNAGNYASARRLLADGWFDPASESLCETLATLGRRPAPDAELTYDRRRVLFLQEDEKDAADISQTDAVSMRQLVEAGYDPQSVTEAITTRDWTKLRHTGNVSVQLQPPGTAQNPDQEMDDDDEDA